MNFDLSCKHEFVHSIDYTNLKRIGSLNFTATGFPCFFAGAKRGSLRTTSIAAWSHSFDKDFITFTSPIDRKSVV